jgi:hypothetical protein
MLSDVLAVPDLALSPRLDQEVLTKKAAELGLMLPQYFDILEKPEESIKLADAG